MFYVRYLHCYDLIVLSFYCQTRTVLLNFTNGVDCYHSVKKLMRLISVNFSNILFWHSSLLLYLWHYKWTLLCCCHCYKSILTRDDRDASRLPLHCRYIALSCCCASSAATQRMIILWVLCVVFLLFISDICSVTVPNRKFYLLGVYSLSTIAC